MTDEKPYIWLIDSSRTPLEGCLDAFDDWAETAYVAPGDVLPDWNDAPDAVFFSAEIPGGAEGELFAELEGMALAVPLLAVAATRSLAQAVAYFRAGAWDYLSLPLGPEEARERLDAALARAERFGMPTVMVELEAVDEDAGQVSLSVAPTEAPDNATAEDEDILADLPPPGGADETETAEEPASPEPEPEPEPELEPEEDEPVAVDGLPIPTLWEELPCGLLVFDSDGNPVFSNTLCLDLFDRDSLAELQEALENNLASFAAHGANHKPLPDNQWPHVLARKTRMPRSAVVSVERRDRRRSWLRIDCLPHLSDGNMSRLSMTVVNMTGELPALAVADAPAVATVKRDKGKQRGRRKR